MYKVEGSSDKAMQFVFANSDLRIATDEGIIIQFIEIDGWLHVMLEIGEYVSNPSTAIRNATPLVLDWKNRLLDFQGPWLGGGDNELLENLLYRQEHETTYQELAERINAKVVSHLETFVAYEKEYSEKAPELKTYLDAIEWRPKNNPYSFEHAKGLLKAIGLKDSDIDQELTDGLDRIKQGKRPFAPNKPVSKKKMRTTLDNWREGKKHKAILAKKAEQTE